MSSISEMLARPYKNIRLEWNPELQAIRVRTRVKPVQCYSLSAIDELQRVLDDVTENAGSIKHFIMSSETAGVFNFGGDLALFVMLIRDQDVASLKLYGRRCVNLLWWMECAAEVGIHTAVLVQGDTLGGGLESVMPFHKIIFERSTQAGFPEVLFNSFPGMGGWHFVIRKAGFVIANELILSGRLYGAQELLDRNIVDVVTEDGTGETALDMVIRGVHPRLRGTLASLKARSLVMPLTYKSLTDIVDFWAEASMRLAERDLKLMERLAKAQIRKGGGDTRKSTEDIKRQELERAWNTERTGITEWAAL